jgi:hypothetical protein
VFVELVAVSVSMAVGVLLIVLASRLSRSPAVSEERTEQWSVGRLYPHKNQRVAVERSIASRRRRRANAGVGDGCDGPIPDAWPSRASAPAHSVEALSPRRRLGDELSGDGPTPDAWASRESAPAHSVEALSPAVVAALRWLTEWASAAGSSSRRALPGRRLGDELSGEIDALRQSLHDPPEARE